MRHKTGFDTERQWSETAKIAKMRWYAKDETIGGRDFFAVALSNHRRWLRGDVFIGYFGNGSGERWEMFGVSSRGYVIGKRCGHYAKFFYHIPLPYPAPDAKKPAKKMRCVEPPEDFIGCRWDAPAVRHFVDGLRTDL